MPGARRDKRRERYSRNLEGLNAQGFFSPNDNTAHSTDTSVAAFLLNAPEGEIGVYDGNGVLHADAITAGEVVRILQKQDGDIKSSIEFVNGSYTVRKTDYDAAVIQESIVGYNGTAGDLNISIVGGLQEFVASAREITPANQPFPVQEGRAIVRSGTPTDYFIANRIVQDLQETYDFERNADNSFVRADIINDATGDATTGAVVWQLLEGSNVATVAGTDVTADAVAGDYLYIDATTAAGSVFTVVSSVFSTDTTVVLDRPWPHPTETIDDLDVLSDDAADGNAAAIGIRFRGADELTVFEVAVSEDLADATLTDTVAWTQGSGEAWQVASMEDEALVFQGWTTNNMPWERDFGRPAYFVDDGAADAYALWFITYDKSVIPSAAPPQNQTLHRGYIIIAAINGSDLETDLDTLFGT